MKFMKCRPVVLVVAAVGCWMSGTPDRSVAKDWTQFRGAASDGRASTACPVRWSSTENVRWKKKLDGEGWSGPVVWQDRVFVTEAVPDMNPRGEEAAVDGVRPEPYRGGGGRRRDDLVDTVYRYDVVCLDAGNGETIWRRTAKRGKPPIPRHSSNTYATETPLTDGERVYAYFGMNGVFCFDMSGGLVWQRDLGEYSMRAGWGTSSSPVLFESKLFIQCDNDEQSFLVALDSRSGEELWRVNRDEASQYSSPIVWQNSQRDELIAGGMTYRSYDPDTGKLLWSLDMAKGRSSATAVAADDRLYVGTERRNRGGADDGGGFLFAVKPGGSGDITPPEGEEASTYVQWKIERSDLQMASPAYAGGCLYILERRAGRLHCIKASTGETAYRQRLPGARAFWASPWSADGRVYCLDTSGTTYVLDAGPDYKLIAENRIDEQAWSSPAVAGGRLFLRTIDHLYCIEEPSH